MSEFLDIVQNFQLAIKTQLMYTENHPRSQAALARLAEVLEEWLATRPSIHIAASQGKLFLDGSPFEGKHIHLTALARQLTERQISGIIFQRGVSPHELAEVTAVLILKPARLEEAGGAAAVLAKKQLPHIQLSQTQYKEVREGEGGEQDHGGASAASRAAAEPLDAATTAALEAAIAALAATMPPAQARPTPPPPPAQPEAPTVDPALLADQWKQQLALLPQPALASAQPFPAANLSYLAGTPLSIGMGNAFPAAQQVEGLRQALATLPPETLLSVVAGVDTLPVGYPGMRMGFQALAAESFGQAAVGLLEGGSPWGPTRDAMFEILRQAPQQQAMLAATDVELRTRGAALEQLTRLQELVQQLDWENQSMEEKLRQAQDQGRMWQLTLDQRLRFLRRLLDEGRVEGLLSLLDVILASLRQEDVAHREMAAQTLTGVARWMEDPGLPIEAEGPLIGGLSAHFGWEPLAHIHRASTEALDVIIGAQIRRDEPGHALTLLRELSGLCAFQDNRQEWREAAVTNLWESLAEPAYLRRVVELLHTANAETMLTELIPYFEAVGHPAAQLLVEILGDEPDRKRRGRLLEAIRCLGDDALPAVFEGLASPTWYLVRNTLNLLADMGDASALEPSQACLTHPDGRVRRAAVRTLWKVGGPAAVKPLLAAFPGMDPETQMEIIFAMGQVRAVQAVPALAGFAQDHRNDERMRVRAAETIGQIGDPGSIPLLVELARRRGRIFTTAESLPVRQAACRALITLDTAEATQALYDLVAAEPWHKDRAALQQVVTEAKIV